MSVWNKVLLFLVFLCAAGFVYFGANALKMRRDSQKKLADAAKSLEDEKNKYRENLYGSGQSDGYVFLLNDVNRLRKIRGIRSWPNCMPHSAAVVRDRTVTLQLVVDANPEKPALDGEMELSLSAEGSVVAASANAPAKDRVLPGTVVYLFDKRSVEEGGCLLGEFSVVKVEENIATLTNVYLMTAEEVKRINDSVAKLAPWGVYSILPGRVPANALANVDRPDATETSSDDETPEDFAAQTDETPVLAGTNDDERSSLGQTFVALNAKRMHLQKHVEIYQLQGASLVDAEKKTNEIMVDFYNKEIESAQALIQKSEQHLAAVRKLHGETTAEIERLETLIANVKALNRKMLADLTKAQILAAEKINERDASLSMVP